MISFSWTQITEEQSLVEIKSSRTGPGTLYRLACCIYALGLDIESGEVNTIEENGQLLASDRFFLRPDGMMGDKKRPIAESQVQLGTLMEMMLSDEIKPDDLLRQYNINPPAIISFFDVSPEMVFETTEKNETEFYIETIGRPGLLLNVTRIFQQENINIVTASIRTTRSGIAQDLFHLQHEGNSLDAAICERLQGKILGKINS